MQTHKEQFEIPGIVRIEPGNGGLSKIIVTTAQAYAEVYLHGAHVTHFQPAGADPVLFMSKSSWFEPSKPIRGGVPICFPWFGPRLGDPKSPAHGFARLREWTIESIEHAGTSVTITLQLKSDDQTRAAWPFEFVARHVITVDSSLEMKLIVENASREPFGFEEALHAYFTVGDVKQVSIEGLKDVQYLDKVDAAKLKQQVDPLIKFTGETDRPYLNTESTCIIHDPSMNRRIEVAKSGSKATVVWNPWINKAKAMPDFGDEEWPGMVCVETANVGDYTIKLAPGAKHEMVARIGLI